MVDRLEELLAQMADEDGEEQEDGLAPEAERAAASVPALALEPGGEEQTESRTERLEWTESAGALAPAQDGGTGETAPAPGWEGLPEDRPPIPAGEAAWRQSLAGADGKSAAGKNWPGMPGMRRGAKQDGEPAQAAGQEAQSGLEALYRRAAQASRPPVQNLPVEQAGRTLRAEEPGRAAALTVDELDRAVRRDSRRYDGGMTIF